MSDPEFHDSVIADAVADYRATTVAAVKPAGAGASIVTARHRRNRHIAAVAVSVAVIMLGTGAGYAALRHDRNGPPVSVPTSVAPAPTESATTKPTPSSRPNSSATSGVATFTAHDLRNATLDLPQWPYVNDCPSGPTKFAGGKAGAITTLGRVVAADVDHDGAGDDVALIRCRPGEGFLGQVVAFHRNADGTFRTIGLVIQPTGGEPVVTKDNQIWNVTDLRRHGSSQVDVRVGSYETTYTDSARQLGTFQWRSYGWNGSEFTQTGGSRSFQISASTAQLATTVSALAFGPPSGGKQHGVMTVKVRNTGSTAVRATLIVLLAEGPAVTADGCSTGEIPECDLGTMPPHSNRTFTFEGDIGAGEKVELRYSLVRLRVGDQVITTDGLHAIYAR